MENSFLNSNVISAFFGAAVGALIPALIEWWREQHRILSDINMTIARLGITLKYLIHLKKAHGLPLKKAFDINKALYQAGQTYELPLVSYKFQPFHFTFTERIFSCVSTKKDILKHVMHNILVTQWCLHEVEAAYTSWNEMCKKFEYLPEEEKSKRFFGIPFSSDSSLKEEKHQMHKIDERIPHTINALLESLDGVLYYIDQSLQSLEKMQDEALILWWLRKEVLKVIINKEDRELIPELENINKGNPNE